MVDSSPTRGEVRSPRDRETANGAGNRRFPAVAARAISLVRLRNGPCPKSHHSERRDDAAIVMSTIEPPHSMGLRVVAEGVETPECWNLLRRLGCDLAQGYLIRRPLSATDVVPFVRQASQSLSASDSTVCRIRAPE